MVSQVAASCYLGREWARKSAGSGFRQRTAAEPVPAPGWHPRRRSCLFRLQDRQVRSLRLVLSAKIFTIFEGTAG